MTTETRAKDVRILVERIITIARTDDMHSRRMARKTLNSEKLVHTLFHAIAPRFTNRPGGYTRITKIGFRRGDAAPMVKLELVTD